MGHMNVSNLLRRAAQRLPDKVALIDASGDTIDFAAFDREADRVATALRAAGIGNGDRVAIAMHNLPQFPFAYFGILRAGAVAVPLNAFLTQKEVTGILEDAGATAAITAPPFEDVIRAAESEVGSLHAIFSVREWAAIAPAEVGPVEPSTDENDLAVLAYTSGTTGEPKGAMLTHRNLLANLRQQMEVPHSAREDDVFLLALPLFHIFGLNVTLGLLAMNGATGLLLDRFEPIPALRAIEQHKVTVLFGAPTMYTAWVDTPGADQYDLSSVRLAISGAAPLAPDVLQRFKEMFGVDVWEGYGLTETAPTLTTNRMADEPCPNSVGMPLPEVELRIVDEDGKDVELGDTGEVIVRGPNVFSGYWNRPEETEAAFTDGWFRTGDVAVRDEEGYIYLVDRKRDLIIVSGFNVFPSEVEDAILRNEKVAEAAVVGVPHPYTGEAVKAYVVLEDGATATPSDLLADVERHIARFKCPRSIEIVEKLPHLLTGKVLRRALKASS
jgi:long-chain acyl-CoA synthetase